MKKFTKILLNLFVSFVFLLNFEVKAQSLGELIEAYQSNLTVTADQQEELFSDISTFSELKRQKMLDTNLWLVDSQQYPFAVDADFYPLKNWFNIKNLRIDFDKTSPFGVNIQTNNKFMPYVEKLIVSEDAKVIFVGDLHADADSLLHIFDNLKEKQYLDANYKNIDKSNYYVFLGDYVDRGTQDLQVLSLLFKFYNENSDNVFLLRGNHEEPSMHLEGDYLGQLKQEYLDFDDAFGRSRDRDLSRMPNLAKKRFYNIHCMFEYLPLALYLGCQDENGVTNFLQCSHAGIEIGYNPQSLLANNNAKYQRILGLKRKTFVTRNEIKYNAGDCNTKLYIDQFYIENILFLGFCWNDFDFENIYNAEPLGLFFNISRGARYGKNVVQKYLDASSTYRFKLCGIVRGHQHGKELFQNRGCVKLWDGLVYTLLGTNLGLGDIARECQWLGCSFNILEMSKNKATWNMIHYFKIDSGEQSEKSYLHFSPINTYIVPRVYADPVIVDAEEEYEDPEVEYEDPVVEYGYYDDFINSVVLFDSK